MNPEPEKTSTLPTIGNSTILRYCMNLQRLSEMMRKRISYMGRGVYIELELQNEELKRTQLGLEKSQENFSRLVTVGNQITCRTGLTN